MKRVDGALLSIAFGRLSLIGLLYGASAVAEVSFDPAVSVGVTHTDNVALSQTDKQAATIYQLLPSFTFAQEGKRFTTDVNYAVQAYRYDELGEDEAYQDILATSVIALDPDNLFLTFGAERDQVIRDPSAPIPWTNLPISSNRTDRDDYYVGSTLKYSFGQNGSVQGSLRRDHVRYNEDPTVVLLREFDTDSLRLSLDNYEKEKGFSWAAHYTADRTDFGLFEPWEYRQAGVEIGGWASPRFRLFASGGKESAWDDPFDASLVDDYWEAGFATRGGQGLSFELAAGERTFGSSTRATLDAVFPHGRVELRYSVEPTTRGRDPYSEWIVASDVVTGGAFDFLNRPGVAERYISRLFHWGMNFELRRSTVGISAYDESREQRVLLDGTTLDDESQTGVDLSATFQAGVRTDVRLENRNGRIDFNGSERRLRSLSIAIIHRLGSRTDVSLELIRTKEESPDLALHYTAKAATVLLSRRF